MKIREEFLPLAVPDISGEEISEVMDALKSGWISVGPKVRKLESEFAAYHGTPQAVAVSSCTAAQFLLCRLLGLQAGDYAIVPTITWPSTASTVEQAGATPIFVDVDRHTLNTTSAHVEPWLKRYGSRVKMISPVHMSGLPVDINGFDALGEKYGVPVVYDAAHAVFSEYRGKRVGGFGLASCFSLYATKNLTAGDGGLITTHSETLAEELRLWSYHGMAKDSWKRYSREQASVHVECLVPGFKLNMTDLNAAVALAQLRRADELLSKRNQLVQHYNLLLEKLDWLEAPIFTTLQGRWGNHVYVVKILDDEIDRDRLSQVLREYNIGTNIHFHPVHLHRFYRDKYPQVQLPVAEWLAPRLLTLPLCSRHTRADVEYVVESLKDIYRKRLAHAQGDRCRCTTTKY